MTQRSHSSMSTHACRGRKRLATCKELSPCASDQLCHMEKNEVTDVCTQQVEASGWNKVRGQWENVWCREHCLSFLPCSWNGLASAASVRMLEELWILQTYLLTRWLANTWHNETGKVWKKDHICIFFHRFVTQVVGFLYFSLRVL